jgi:vancomycin resistance protein YoaR
MKKMRWIVWFTGVMVATVVVAAVVHWRVFFEKVIPYVKVSGIEISGVSERDLRAVLETDFLNNPNEIYLEYEGDELARVADLQIVYDYDWTVNLAMSVGRNGNLLTQIRERVTYLLKPLDIEPAISYDEDGLEGLISLVDEKIKQEYVPARISLDQEGAPEFVLGKDGVSVNEDGLSKLIIKAMKQPGKQIVEVPVNKSEAVFNKERVDESLELANKWLDKAIVLEYEYYKKELLVKEVVSLMGVNDSILNETAFEELFLLLETEVNREPRNAVFMFENGGVTEFQADIKGVELDRAELKNTLEKALTEFNEKVALPVKLTEPEIKASEVNDLGIKELLGRGESSFSHSIPSRVFNVALAAKRINYALIPPGEVFSFNKEVGEISSATGYQSAYVIKDGRTVLGDGGGTCQVSTTMFRAAMRAGLPIVERKAHSYRVTYYEQGSGPGVDATVYAPTADLKFLNDTPEHILVQTVVDTKNLTMQVDIFGTSDGRVSSISEPKVWGQSPPPEPLFEDDPTLAVGVVKQIDWAAWGAKTSFEYEVERDGEMIYEKTFYSSFRPWQAVYLRGVGN